MDIKICCILVVPLFFSACGDASEQLPPANLDIRSAIPLLDEQCPFGGTQIDSGMDLNNNGLLEALEIAQSQVECAGESTTALDEELTALAGQLLLSGDPSLGRILPTIDAPLSQLGMQLFFSKALSGDQDVACVSCHHPFLGGGDNLHLPVGVAAETPDLLGSGRRHRSGAPGFDGGPTVPRNAPTTFNLAFWDSVLFHDGRIESFDKTPGRSGAGSALRTPDVLFSQPDDQAQGTLANAQARFPVTSPEEMRGFTFEIGNNNAAVRDHLTNRINGELPELSSNRWLEAFQTGFARPAATSEELIKFSNITHAIAQYEESQVFIDNPWENYLSGQQDSLSGDAKLGALLFFGKAGCSNCHTGDFFTDEAFHVVGMPQIGRGKGDGPSQDGDFGRFRETGLEQDRFAFRTPSLLNVAVTGPYGHAGGYTELEDAVRHHSNPRSAIENYDLSQLPPGMQTDNFYANTLSAVQQLEGLQATGDSLLTANTLTDTEVDWLTRFLVELTDPCVLDRLCLSKWVPDTSTPDPDGLRVEAIDEFGNPL